jgi:transposase-like protein
MGRPPVIPPERKTRIVRAVLAGEISIAEAARKEQVSEQSISRWKTDFVEAGSTAHHPVEPLADATTVVADLSRLRFDAEGRRITVTW